MRCFWCHKQEATNGWACWECYQVKEASYMESAKKGDSTYAKVIKRARQSIKKHYKKKKNG